MISQCFLASFDRSVIIRKTPCTFRITGSVQGVLIFNFTDNGGSSKAVDRKGVSRPYGKRRSEVKGQRYETTSRRSPL